MTRSAAEVATDVDVSSLGAADWARISREVPLPLGEIGWLFPALAHRTEHQRVQHLLQAADEALYRLGQRPGARPDARLWDVPLNRFYYQRLGPEPEFPATILAGEGGSDRTCVDVLCAPADHGPYLRPGPPWQVHATVSLRCDSDSIGCDGHQVDARPGPPVETPVAWLLQRLANETEDSQRRTRHKRTPRPLSSLRSDRRGTGPWRR